MRLCPVESEGNGLSSASGLKTDLEVRSKLTQRFGDIICRFEVGVRARGGKGEQKRGGRFDEIGDERV